MTDKTSDNKKPVKNQLFSASVTGATFEEFSQNALLFPAQEIPPVNTSPPIDSYANPQVPVSEPALSSSPSFEAIPQEPKHTQAEQPKSPLSSVFSSFSTILTYGGPSATNTNKENVMQQEQSNLESVPLSVSAASVPTTFSRPTARQSPLLQGLSNTHQPAIISPYLFSISPDLQRNENLTGSRRLSVELPSSYDLLNSNVAKQTWTPQGTFTNSTKPQLDPYSFPPQGDNNASHSNLESVPLHAPTSNSGFNVNPLISPAILSIRKPDPIPPTGGNLYRRTGLKKPSYAQIPGLLSSSQPLSIKDPQLQQSFQPSTSNTQFNQYSITPLNPSPQTVSKPESYFKPIVTHSKTPSPPSTNTITSTYLTSLQSQQRAQSVDLIAPSNPESTKTFPHSSPSSAYFDTSIFSPPSTSTNIPSSTIPFFTPASTSSLILSSPVMAAIPDNEVLQSTMTSAQTQSANVPYSGQSGSQQTHTLSLGSSIYRPVYHHWFYKRIVEGRILWDPFSMADSLDLENAFTSTDLTPETVVATDGGRYDVNILRRERYPVYWKGTPTEVRRCSWFHKKISVGRFVPYEENIATKLENEYRTAFETNEWHRPLELVNGDSVVFHGPENLVLFPPTPATIHWENTPETPPRPKVLKRGMDEFHIDDGEPSKIDHLLFLVHGIGSVCDLKFRTIEEVVDEFRAIAFQLVKSHYRLSCDRGIANRIEVLPISWHDSLHSDETGIDKTLKNITLESIPRLRDFTNDTLLDILFYTSPVYCQTIMSTVGTEMNRLYELFRQRNPTFGGSVSVSGHSLGSLIMFDLLCHQHPDPEPKTEVGTEPGSSKSGEDDVVPPLKKPSPKERTLNRRISYMMSEAGTGQPQLFYPKLDFQPIAFFALGSPIGMFVTVRGLEKLGIDFELPTCPAFFNIFHPYDPVAYRLESLINPQLAGLKPFLIPHHKGRKRMHLELKDTMVRVGADLKQKLVDSMKTTWNSFFQIALFGRHGTQGSPSLEVEVDRVLKEKLAEEEAKAQVEGLSIEDQNTDLCLGALNKGRRIDYVLQEAPFEFFNEYIFALTSHVVYWESEDTVLLVLKEIYSSMGVSPDNQIPQPNMTIERSSVSLQPVRVTESPVASSSQMGMDPTVPIHSTNIGPPPMSGFVKKA